MHSRGEPRGAAARLSARLAAGAVAALTLFVLAACSRSPMSAMSFAPVAAPPSPAITQKSTVENMLAKLQISNDGPKPSYSADRFGAGWLAVPGTSCDAFNFVLERDLTNAVLDRRTQCSVVGGSLFDTYTATWSWYDPKANPSTLAIDRVVSLPDAWISGAYAWDDTRRALFANFADELMASTVGAVNAKNGADAAGWLPPNSEARCEYVSLQIKIKSAYVLTVSQAEHDALARVLQVCPDNFSRPFPTTPPPPPPSGSPLANLTSAGVSATNEAARTSTTPQPSSSPAPPSATPPAPSVTSPPASGSSPPPLPSVSPSPDPSPSSSPTGDPWPWPWPTCHHKRCGFNG